MFRLLPREKHELPMQIMMESRVSGAIAVILFTHVCDGVVDLECPKWG
jgi:hypothetical protein